MAARLTIVLDPDALKALRASNSIKVVAGSSGGNGRTPRAAAARRAPRGAAGGGAFREGSLPARLMAWARGRRTFGVPDLMRKFGIKRGHASMLVAYVVKARAARRVARGAYAAS
jgi:hypothetical protein